MSEIEKAKPFLLLEWAVFPNTIIHGKKQKTMKKNQHVTPTPSGKWQVIGAGNSKATVLKDTQSEAIEAATQIAKNQGGEVVIHGRDGQIRDADSYGNDPIPPRDKKH
jgi:hypothetical protein